MEKYGVELDEEKSKTAGSSKTCPSCGEDLETDQDFAPLSKCPKCGTKPFEKSVATPPQVPHK